jgi:hypothetical protein
VTASAGSNATAIGANKVLTAMIADAQITLAKMANLAADTIIGRANGAGTGVPTALTAAQVAAIIQATLDVRYGQLAGNNTWSGTNKFDGEVTLSPGGTQDYVIGNVLHTLTLQAQSAGTDADVRIYTFDGDATDSILFSLWGKGTPAAATNRERLLMGWFPATNTYEIWSEANGTGTLRPFILYTEGNTEQLYLATDGKVGAGIIPTTQLSIKAGTSTNDAAVGGVLYVTAVTVGQVGAGPDTLATYSVPANTLAVNNQSLWWRAAGTMAGTSCSIPIKFGATTLITLTGSPVGTGEWWAEGEIYRTGAATQRAVSHGGVNQGSTDIRFFGNVTPAETLSGAVTFLITGTSSSNNNNDTVLSTLKIGFDDANT